jgi:hypothetical protein
MKNMPKPFPLHGTRIEAHVSIVIATGLSLISLCIIENLYNY